jgi:hypothetical protein
MVTQTTQDLPNGPVAAALLAGGIGAAALGVTTTLSESVPSIATAFNWHAPVGPLIGEVGVALIIYFVSWIVLHAILRSKNVNFARITTISIVLLIIGLLGTFPPFFELFAK